MKYKITHPFSGLSTVFSSVEEANQFKELIIEQEIAKIDSLNLISNIASEILVAKDFAKRLHGYTGELEYFHSVWNVDTQSRLCAFYTMQLDGELWELKVTNGVVTEQYRCIQNKDNWILNANDLNDNSKIEYYEFVDKDLNIIPNAFGKLISNTPNTPEIYALAKFDLNNNRTALNIWGKFDDLPLDKKELLQNFEYKDTIFEYKQQSYGFVVHYYEKIYEPSTLEEQADWINRLDLQVQEIPDA